MSAKKRLTKAQIVTELADNSELDKKSINRVFEGLSVLIKRELKKKDGEFVIPGLLKLKVRTIPARKAEMRMDPFTKQERMFPAKPASKRVRATALKALKDMVQ